MVILMSPDFPRLLEIFLLLSKKVIIWVKKNKLLLKITFEVYVSVNFCLFWIVFCKAIGAYNKLITWIIVNFPYLSIGD